MTPFDFDDVIITIVFILVLLSYATYSPEEKENCLVYHTANGVCEWE